MKIRRQTIIRMGNGQSGNSDIAEAADFSSRQVELHMLSTSSHPANFLSRQVELNMLSTSSHRAEVPAVTMVTRDVRQNNT